MSRLTAVTMHLSANTATNNTNPKAEHQVCQENENGVNMMSI